MSKKYAINTIKHPSIWEGLVRLPLLLLLLSFSVTLSAQNADKLYKEAKALYDAKDYTQAFPKLKTAAEKGHKKAQYRLGRCYEKGRGVTKDEIAAFQWYGKSAAQDYAKAQYAVGNCYKEGIGTAKDHITAHLIRFYDPYFSWK